MRFTPGSIPPSLSREDIGKSIDKQEMYFIPLGNILLENSKSQDKLADERWIDTRFILVLRVQQDGTSGGLYMVCNMTGRRALTEEYFVLDTDTLNPDSDLLKLCSDSPSFTIAKVKRRGYGYFSSFSRLPAWSDSPANFKELELEIVSVSMPEIVQTGHKIDKEHRATFYGMFPPEDATLETKMTTQTLKIRECNSALPRLDVS